MRKSFKLDEIDCANCAAKLENKIKQLDGVEDASVTFMTQKLTIQAQDDTFDEVFSRVEQLIARVEPDCEIIRP